tara:strand:+ start:2511 stop:3884 length:1374 start_codon:yes stop_codon:yes gene_type:complete
MNDLDLDIENYSVNDIRKLFGLGDNYTQDALQENVDAYLNMVGDSDEISPKNKKRISQFLNSLRVTLIRHLNNSGLFRDDGLGGGGGGGGALGGVLGGGGASALGGGSSLDMIGDGPGYGKGAEVARGIDHELTRPNIVEPYFDQSHKKNDNIHTYRDTDNVDGEVHVVKYKRDRLNQIKQETFTRCITIDTRFRENYATTSSTNFKCHLADKFTNVVSVQLSALEFPTSFFVIDDTLGNNFFSYQIIEEGIFSVIKTVVIPSGNYSHSDLLSEINDSITANGDSISLSVDITTMGSGTGKSIIANQGSQMINVYFNRDKKGNQDDTPIPLKFGWILGFRDAEFIGNTRYVSSGMYDDHGSRYMFLVVNDHNNCVDTYISLFNSSVMNRNILARISMKTPTFHILNETGIHLITEPRKYLGPVSISTLDIQIIDEFGRVINLNNMDYSMCLNIECLY